MDKCIIVNIETNLPTHADVLSYNNQRPLLLISSEQPEWYTRPDR